MIDHAQTWLRQQLASQHELLLVIDCMAEPDPIPELFAADLMQDYRNLLLGTAFDGLADIGPWLVRLTSSDSPAIQELLHNPQRLWGWLACAEPRMDIQALARHWLDRIPIEENGQRSLYRFQDPRVLARSLAYMPPDQVPQLLGPLRSVLFWDGDHWRTHDNPTPGLHTFSQPAPWLYPEPPAIAREIHLDNLEQWLWENQPERTAALAREQMLREWLDECLTLGANWQWESTEQLYLLIDRRRGANATDSRWLPLDHESPQGHFERCRLTFANTETGSSAHES